MCIRDRGYRDDIPSKHITFLLPYYCLGQNKSFGFSYRSGTRHWLQIIGRPNFRKNPVIHPSMLIEMFPCQQYGVYGFFSDTGWTLGQREKKLFSTVLWKLVQSFPDYCGKHKHSLNHNTFLSSWQVWWKNWVTYVIFFAKVVCVMK